MTLGYMYTYACHEDERDLCLLELKSLFGVAPSEGFFASMLNIDPSRSPFIKQRVSLLFRGQSLAELAEQATSIELTNETFKVIYLGLQKETELNRGFEQKRVIEREIGSQIRGKAEMRKPQHVFAVMQLDHEWLLGESVTNKATWLMHQSKPQNYSTALNTRLARAAVNIAVSNSFDSNVQVIDPCCGIGTVLIEARSMGIDIVGYDNNPLAVKGARVNLAYFGLECPITLLDMRLIQGSYNAAILDLPYNLCSVSSPEDQLEMLQSTRRIADKAVIITTESIDEIIAEAGFTILDRCTVRKGSFSRQIIVCK